MPYPTPPVSLLRSAVLFQLLAAVGLGALVAWTAASSAEAQVAPEGNVRLSPASSQVQASDGVFTVYVVLEGLQHSGNVFYDDNRDGEPDRQVPSEGLGAFEFTIEFEDSIVEYVDADAGPALNSTGRSFQCLGADLEPGSVTFGCLSPGADPAGPQGTLTLAAVRFRPIGNGLSPLVLEVESAGPLGDSIEVTRAGGTARVSGATSLAPTDTPDDENATSTQELSGPVATELAATAQSGSATEAAGGGATPDPTEAVQTATAEAEATARATAQANPTPDDAPDGGCIEGEEGCEDDGGSNYTWVWVAGAVVALSVAGLGLGGLYLRGRP